MTPAAYSVDDIYQLVNFICNKKQSGAVGPDAYNNLLKMINLEMFKVHAGLPEEFQYNGAVPRRAWQSSTKITDILFPFHKVRFIAKAANEHFPIPDDYAAFSSMMRVEVADTNCNDTVIKKTWRRIEFVTEAERADRLPSLLKPPTMRHPIGAYYGLGILVNPEEIMRIRLAYLRYPATPFRNYDNVNDEDKYVALGSVQLEWPAIAQNDFIIRICRYIGINIREEELVRLVMERQNRGE